MKKNQKTYEGFTSSDMKLLTAKARKKESNVSRILRGIKLRAENGEDYYSFIEDSMSKTTFNDLDTLRTLGFYVKSISLDAYARTILVSW